MFNMSIIDYPKLIDNVGDYLYLKESENGNFKFEVDAYQLDLRLHHFSQFPLNVKKRSVIGWRSD